MSNGKVIDRKQIFFNSKSQSVKNSFTLQFQNSLFNLTDITTYGRVYIKKLIIPNNFNNVNTSNNSYIWNGQPYYLSSGDPTIYDIINELLTNGINASYDTDTSLVSITSNGTLDISSSNSIASLIGFSVGIISTPATGTIPVNVRLTNSIFLTSNLGDDSSYEYNIQGELISSPIILQVPINVSRYANIIYEDDVGYNSIILQSNPRYNNLYFELMDESKNLVNILSDWFCELVIEIVQDQNSILRDQITTLTKLVDDIKGIHHLNTLGNILEMPHAWSVP